MDILSQPLQNFVAGRWIEAERSGLLPVENPSDATILAQVPLSTAAETLRAIDAASSAFPAWSRTPVARRAQYLFALLERLRKAEEEIARSISAENGKS
ncbi:MAG: aldehyde dehydrogenase family protein, partial [Verrucomicrobiales bacterium]|nr:aldehyde dehydrogenase family protein [Verrucomicrobiales bacterium]